MSAVLDRHAHVHPLMASVLNGICPAPLTQQERDQAFFDKSLAHIRAQGRASATPVNADRPMASNVWYRHPNGDTCTIGCHFGDQYDPSLETVPVATLMKERRYIARALGFPTPDLATSVQIAHDTILRLKGMEAFELEMSTIAWHYRLSYGSLGAA